jgi:hypothetical protein
VGAKRLNHRAMKCVALRHKIPPPLRERWRAQPIPCHPIVNDNPTERNPILKSEKKAAPELGATVQKFQFASANVTADEIWGLGTNQGGSSSSSSLARKSRDVIVSDG